MDIVYWKLCVVALGVALMLYFIARFKISKSHKCMISGVVIGLLIFNGVGAAYLSVPEYYLIYFLFFLVSYVLSFRFFLSVLKPISRDTKLVRQFSFSVDYSNVWRIVTVIYLLLSLFPFIYPDIRIQQILRPPAPDLASLFRERFEIVEIDILNKLLFYIRVLITPLFFISIYRYRYNFFKVLIVLALPLYLRYIDQAYISRGEILVVIGSLLIGFWFSRPDLRTKIKYSILVILPLFMIFSYVWQIVRLGGDLTESNFLDALELLIDTQTNFPAVSGVPLIESGKYVDFAAYLKWIATMPFPKLLIGEVEGARISYEISEIVLNKFRGEVGFYILLPGVVAESVYIFGKYFFWVQAIFLSFVCAFLVRVTESIKSGNFLLGYVITLFSYVMTRGGVGAILPEVINGFILYYFVYFALILSVRGGSRNSSLHQVKETLHLHKSPLLLPQTAADTGTRIT